MTDWTALIERAKTRPQGRQGRRPAPREHGTEKGYQQHRRNEPACGPCRHAHNVHVQARQS